MRSATLVSICLGLAGHGRQLRRILRPIHRRRRRVGKEINRHEQRSGEQIARLQMSAQPVRHQDVHHPAMAGGGILVALGRLRNLTPYRCGSTEMVTGTENSERLHVELRADIGDLADGHPADLHRRAGRQPADRGLLEDEQESVRIAGGGRKASLRSSNRVKTVSASAGGRSGPVAGVSNAMPPARMDMSDSVWTCRPAGGERHINPAGMPETRVRGDILVVRRLHEHLDVQSLRRSCPVRTTRPGRPGSCRK